MRLARAYYNGMTAQTAKGSDGEGYDNIGKYNTLLQTTLANTNLSLMRPEREHWAEY